MKGQSDEATVSLGEPRQRGVKPVPYTFKGIFANAAMALVRIAAALERIAAIQERKLDA